MHGSRALSASVPCPISLLLGIPMRPVSPTDEGGKEYCTQAQERKETHTRSIGKRASIGKGGKKPCTQAQDKGRHAREAFLHDPVVETVHCLSHGFRPQHMTQRSIHCMEKGTVQWFILCQSLHGGRIVYSLRDQ